MTVHGNDKGVIVELLDDKYMPRDKASQIAEIIMEPRRIPESEYRHAVLTTMIKRIRMEVVKIMGLDETTTLSDVVAQGQGKIDQAFITIVNGTEIINPEFANKLRKYQPETRKFQIHMTLSCGLAFLDTGDQRPLDDIIIDFEKFITTLT